MVTDIVIAVSCLYSILPFQEPVKDAVETAISKLFLYILAFWRHRKSVLTALLAELKLYVFFRKSCIKNVLVL
jgi:hypothetical protein